MGRRTWIKIYVDKWLRGTLRRETAQMRGIWADVLALAGDSAFGDVGKIQVAEGEGWKDTQIAKLLMLSDAEWCTAKQRLVDTKRIEVTKSNVIQILKWERYQSEYERQKKYRLHDEVTPDSDTEKREERREKENIKTFEQFWSLYPRKVGKKPALRKWRQISPSPKLAAQILESLGKHLALPQWREARYIPHPTTWLNQERWEDEMPSGSKKKRNLWETS